MVFIMLGAPGAGKGTIGKRLAEEIGVKYIASGDVFRRIMNQESELANEIRNCINVGKLVPDELAIKIFMEEIMPENVETDLILDGYPRTEGQAKHLDEFLRSKGLQVNATINIEVSDELIIDRIINRRICPKCNAIYNAKYGTKPNKTGICDRCGSKLIKRIDDNEKTVKDRLAIYEINTKPLINYYETQGKLRNIYSDENTSIEEIVNLAKEYTKK